MLIMAALLSLGIIDLIACTSPLPIVRQVTVHTTIEPWRCALPELPQSAMIVGYPDVTAARPVLARSDVEVIREELTAWRTWATAVAECLAAP